MRILLLLLLPLIAFAQPAVQRTPLTTNRAPVTYSNGDSPIWNSAMAAWSNGVSSGISSATVTGIVNAALINPNVVWVATNGNNATGDGSYNKPLANPSNGVAYARTTYGNNWTVKIRSGRYDVNGFVTGLDETNKQPINVHGGTNIAIIGEGFPIIYSTNFNILSTWAVDGLLIQGIAFEGQKVNTNINALDATVQLRGGTRNVMINDCRFTRIPNHGIGAFYSTIQASNILISSCIFEDVGATSGVVGLTIDGACIVPDGSRWITVNCIMDRAVRVWEPYSSTNIENLVFSGNIITRCRFEGITLVPENGWISNVVVSGNMFINPESIGQNRVFIRAASARSVNISDNLVDGPMEAGISMVSGVPDGFRDWFVTGNTFQNNPLNGYGVYMEHAGTRASTNISFTANKFLNLFGPAMSLRGPGLIVKDNEFINVAIEGAGSAALRVSNEAGTTRDGVIMGNLFKPSIAADGGVQLGAGVTNWTVVGNFFDGWAQHPITDANAPGINPKPINSTTNGVFTGTNIARFGINTNNPQAALHVVGNAIVSGTNSVNVLNVGTLTLTNPLSIASGGLSSSLLDPNLHRLLGWNDTAGSNEWFSGGANIDINAGTVAVQRALTNLLSFSLPGTNQNIPQVFTYTNISSFNQTGIIVNAATRASRSNAIMIVDLGHYTESTAHDLFPFMLTRHASSCELVRNGQLNANQTDWIRVTTGTPLEIVELGGEGISLHAKTVDTNASMLFSVRPSDVRLPTNSLVSRGGPTIQVHAPIFGRWMNSTQDHCYSGGGRTNAMLELQMSVDAADDLPHVTLGHFGDTNGGFVQFVTGGGSPETNSSSAAGHRPMVLASYAYDSNTNRRYAASIQSVVENVGLDVAIGYDFQTGYSSNRLTTLSIRSNSVIVPASSGLQVGPSGGVLTNVLYASATLNFAVQSVGGVEDLPITVAGASDGDIVSLGYESTVTTGIAGSFSGFASNDVVFVRFVATGATQNPNSGLFKVRVDKFR